MAVDKGIINEVGGQLIERVFSGILWFGIAIVIIGVLGGLMYYFFIYKRKFDIKVLIKSNRADDRYSLIEDKAAILKEWKTKIPYFRVWGLARDFPVPKYKVLQKTDKGDFLEIYRHSEEEFYFLTPAKIDQTVIIRADGKRVPIAQQSQIKSDPEMAWWVAKRKSKNKSMFDTESLIMKILPYLPHIIGGVILIFVLYILMDTLPQILSSLQQLVESMNSMRVAEVTVSNV